MWSASAFLIGMSASAGCSRRTRLAAFAVLLAAVSAELGGGGGPIAPSLQWHGVYDATTDMWIPSVLDRPASLVVRLQGTKYLLNKCVNRESAAVFALDETSQLAIAGCFTACPTVDWRNCGEARGVSLKSDDGGLTWAPLNLDVPGGLLKYVRSTFVTVKSAGNRMFCRIGGHVVVEANVSASRVEASASPTIACSRDGYSWWAANGALPEGRSSASHAVHTLPGESLPRVFLFGGVRRYWPYTEDTFKSTETVLMSNPIDLGPGAVEAGSAIRSWTVVASIPATLSGRHLPVVGTWPGLPADADPMVGEDYVRADVPFLKHAGVLVGFGYGGAPPGGRMTELEEWMTDLWFSPDPTNASSWSRINTAMLGSSRLEPVGTWSNIGAPFPVVFLQGDMTRSSLGTLSAGAPALLTFTESGAGYVFAGNPPYWSKVRSRSASAVEMAASDDSETMVFTAYTVTSAAVQQDANGRPYVVSLFGELVMRAFTARCDYTCPAGQYAARCGIDYMSPICVPCSTCEGAITVDGVVTNVPRYETAACQNAPNFRVGNVDTTCEACSKCGEGNITLKLCTPQEDTTCGPAPGRPVYLPTSSAYTESHHVALSFLPIAAAVITGIVLVGGLWLQYGGWLCFGESGVAGVDKAGAGAAGSAVAAAMGLGPAGGPVSLSSAPGVPTIPPEVANTPEAKAYVAARDASIRREQRWLMAWWFATCIAAAADVCLALLSSSTFAAFGLSMVWGDAPGPGVPLWVHDSFKRYGVGMLVLLVLHSAVLVVRGVWLMATHWLHLETLAMARWMASRTNKVLLGCALMLVPLHSRLTCLLVPSGPLALPMPLRVHTALAVMSPASLFLLDLPALIIICAALWNSGIPVGTWGQPGALAPVPYWALSFAYLNLAATSVRLAWDMASCVRSGGIYRLRRALADVPACSWLLSLLLPRKPTVAFADTDADVVPRMVVPVASSDGGSHSYRMNGHSKSGGGGSVTGSSPASSTAGDDAVLMRPNMMTAPHAHALGMGVGMVHGSAGGQHRHLQLHSPVGSDLGNSPMAAAAVDRSAVDSGPSGEVTPAAMGAGAAAGTVLQWRGYQDDASSTRSSQRAGRVSAMASPSASSSHGHGHGHGQVLAAAHVRSGLTMAGPLSSGPLSAAAPPHAAPASLHQAFSYSRSEASSSGRGLLLLSSPVRDSAGEALVHALSPLHVMGRTGSGRPGGATAYAASEGSSTGAGT